MPQISLSDYIFQIKRELMERENDVDITIPLLSIDEIELEVAVTVTGEGQGGVKFWVVELGAGVKREDVQTVRIKMAPLLTHEERVTILKERYPDYFNNKVIPAQIIGTLKGDEPSKDEE